MTLRFVNWIILVVSAIIMSTVIARAETQQDAVLSCFSNMERGVAWETCLETSLGMTPISGLVMGSRVGDIDPGVLIYMLEEMNMSWKELKNVLNKESGLVGLYGDNDLRRAKRIIEYIVTKFGMSEKLKMIAFPDI